jgi:hypothetical protein
MVAAGPSRGAVDRCAEGSIERGIDDLVGEAGVLRQPRTRGLVPFRLRRIDNADD